MACALSLMLILGVATAQGPALWGIEFQINSHTTDDQKSPAVTVDSGGEFVVVWASYGSYGTDTSNMSIQGQRFASPIFTNGFESGDTSLWSRTVQ